MSEKITIEVTPEMISAVREHDKAEEARKQKEWQDERVRRYLEWEARIEREARDKARALLPDLTDAQYEVLKDIFCQYHDEMRNSW